MIPWSRRGRVALAVWLAIAQIGGAWAPLIPLPPAAAQSADSGDLVDRGRALYQSARFEEAINLLAGPVDRRALPASQLLQARELLARSYVKLGQIAKARTAFTAQLADDPSWRPNPDQVPPDEIAVFQESLTEYQRKNPPVPPKAPPQDDSVDRAIPPSTVSDLDESKPWWKSPWAIAGIILAGVGIAALVGGGGGDDGGNGGGNQELPVPPPPPGVIGQGGSPR